MRHLLTAAFALAASPALAASGPFISLGNTNFIVLLAFLLFIGVLVYFKVPSTAAKMLDKRAEDIRSDLEEARQLREEAQSLLASYERKQKEVQEQADRIVENARAEAKRSAEQSKKEIAESIDRRLAAAEEQLEAARAAAVKDVRDRAIAVATAAAKSVVEQSISGERRNQLIDESISTVDAKLH